MATHAASPLHGSHSEPSSTGSRRTAPVAREPPVGRRARSLFTLWPAEAGRITRVLYSPPDWEDHPRSVSVPGRRVKTGSFPHDDTHLLTLSLRDGRRRRITVIPPDASPQDAQKVIDGVLGDSGHRESADTEQAHGNDEGGHPAPGGPDRPPAAAAP